MTAQTQMKLSAKTISIDGTGPVTVAGKPIKLN
jgi:hypothetical protein